MGNSCATTVISARGLWGAWLFLTSLSHTSLTIANLLRQSCLVSFWLNRIISLNRFRDMLVLKKGSPHSFDHKSSISKCIPLCTPLAKRSAVNAFSLARLNFHAACPLRRASATEQSQMFCNITRSIRHMNTFTGSLMLQCCWATSLCQDVMGLGCPSPQSQLYGSSNSAIFGSLIELTHRLSWF